MKYVVLLVSLMLFGAVSAWAATDTVVYFVVPQEKGVTAEKILASDLSTVKFSPMFKSNVAKKILYFVNPMNPKIKAYKFQQDSMGMDYLPATVDDSKKVILFYVNPMDKKTISKKAMKDDMGMDYIPVYLMPVTVKEE